MYYVVDISSLNNTVNLYEVEYLNFKPTGNYRYINIFQDKNEAESFRDRVEVFVLNYEMFNSLEYSLDRRGIDYAKNKKNLFENLCDSDFTAVENLFNTTWNRFVKNLGSSELIKTIISNYDSQDYYKIYSKCTLPNDEAIQMNTLNQLLEEKRKKEQAEALQRDIGFFNAMCRLQNS